MDARSSSRCRIFFAYRRVAGDLEPYSAILLKAPGTKKKITEKSSAGFKKKGTWARETRSMSQEKKQKKRSMLVLAAST